jgi:hypothetical protein
MISAPQRRNAPAVSAAKKCGSESEKIPSAVDATPQAIRYRVQVGAEMGYRRRLCVSQTRGRIHAD